MSKTKLTSTDAKTKINSIKAMAKELKKTQKSTANKAVGLLKELINSHDMIRGVRWAQYTPYFNDGDPCEFGVHDMEFLLQGEEDYIQEWDVEEYIKKQKDVLNYEEVDDLQKICVALGDMHGEIAKMGDVLKGAFGDHTWVTVTRKGIETDHHEHD